MMVTETFDDAEYVLVNRENWKELLDESEKARTMEILEEHGIWDDPHNWEVIIGHCLEHGCNH